MKKAEIRELSDQELQKKLGESRRELLTLRIQQANQQLKNPLKLREVRRGIARILTIIREKKSA
ncbi:MAG: 50S ribosomal protein L29 [Candidatus Margulisbacteria bacterium]|nr:50S ribosomal protein L29 [Candidatus Margulisiibacteriota bacterium]